METGGSKNTVINLTETAEKNQTNTTPVLVYKICFVPTKLFLFNNVEYFQCS